MTLCAGTKPTVVSRYVLPACKGHSIFPKGSNTYKAHVCKHNGVIGVV